jgi:L-rhamnose-H+ transport protein
LFSHFPTADERSPDSGALADTPARTLWITALFGFGWGVANVLFGLSVALIGMALTFAIVGGMSAAFGSLIPLVLLTPDRLGTARGRMILFGVALTTGGVAALGTAGRIRERARRTAGSPQSLRLGLLLYIISGVLAPMLNFSFAFGSVIAANAVNQGATTGNAANAIWSIGLFGALSATAAMRLSKWREAGPGSSSKRAVWGGYWAP